MSGFRRQCLLICFTCCTVTGMIVEYGEDLVQQRRDDATKTVGTDVGELYHPGTPPSHITRLGRFHHDKAGMALLVKSEAAFMDRPKVTDHPASLEQTVEVDKPSVVWMPSSYHKILREHQRELKRKLAGADDAHKSLCEDGKTHTSRPEAAMVQDGQVPAPDSSIEGVPIANADDPANNAGGADSVIMPLRLLRSEYMGPMGVGTMVPKHCKQDSMSVMAAVSAPMGRGRHHRRHPRGYGALDVESDMSIGEDDSALSEQASNIDFGSNVALDDNSSNADEKPNSDCTARQQTYLNVVYDTGSTNIWISSDLCTSGGCVLPGRRRFNHLESTTFSFPEDSPTLSVQFGTGKLSGPLGTDSLRVGPVSVHQTFAMMQNQAGWIWEDVPIEGIVGLAFPSLANTGQGLPFFDSVIEQKVLKRNEFAFYISRENPAANAIMWGGVDSRFYSGRIEWFPVVDPHYWGLDLAEFRVGNVSFNFTPQVDTPFGEFNSLSMGLNFMTKPKHGPLAVLDTGTSVLGFSNMLMSNLLELLPEAPCRDVLEDGANGTQLKYPDMVFVLRNRAGQLRDFALTGRQYMSRDDKGDSCSPAVMTLDLPVAHGPGVVLGDVFLREYFSVYNRRDGTPQAADVGLARSKRTEDVVEHLKTLTDDQQSLLHA
eukprot:TRINITY_DN113_c0_g1_i7.p1 TRINITY_DN113_c0_g1~~TRINITY_DN113_c0_g1_i7.p1  ORF type:complete len:657 (-),score=102.59 TRINITY_DN113_c0_g1_i7:100-2070(-)